MFLTLAFSICSKDRSNGRSFSMRLEKEKFIEIRFAFVPYTGRAAALQHGCPLGLAVWLAPALAKTTKEVYGMKQEGLLASPLLVHYLPAFVGSLLTTSTLQSSPPPLVPGESSVCKPWFGSNMCALFPNHLHALFWPVCVWSAHPAPEPWPATSGESFCPVHLACADSASSLTLASQPWLRSQWRSKCPQLLKSYLMGGTFRAGTDPNKSSL